MTPELLLVLRDGAVMAAAGAALIMGTLRLNPRLFIRHYPAQMQEKTAPLTPRERLVGRALGLALVALLIGGPLASTRAAAAGLPDYGARVLHAWGVATPFHLTDWLGLDELWLGLLRPRWALLPGAEDVPFTFDHRQHLRGFVVGMAASLVIALAVAV